jgi:hypothetical protein
VNDASLYSQTLCHSKCKAAGGNAFAIETLSFDIFQIQEEWHGKANKTDKLHDLMLSDSPPAGDETITGMKALVVAGTIHWDMPLVASSLVIGAWGRRTGRAATRPPTGSGRSPSAEGAG